MWEIHGLKASMHYRVLGKTGIRVSEIGFGAWAIGGASETAGVQWGWGEVSEADAIAAVRRARELGVNFFDTANVYGKGRSEQLLGKALSGDWSNVYVASKVGNVERNGLSRKDWSREHIVASCEAGLARLNKDVIDLYQLHNPDEQTIRHGDWPETMELLRKQGKIRWYGVSVFSPEEALAVLERGQGHTIQLVYNALRQEMAEEVFPMALKKNFGIIARVPLYYGILTGKFAADTIFPANDHRSHTLPPDTLRQLVARAEQLKSFSGDAPPAQWALRFAISHHAVSTIIPGARNARQVEQNCAASDGLGLPKQQILAARQMWQEDEYLRNLRSGQRK
jgi:aryl-alcohol dehydrogenase-like predicted oxidoreductase